ncbi:hypothetical protein MKX07_003867 [Trichoderma sp. CBMAI-0711]|uniref:Uncharacterized protein n=1 Tax=Trichoderma parareesei TaxID=858221 RepID=A0A2H2ZS72_TRIPA|nr:hypothetical protein MKX07_003867 [Trichoderma sp. CBMAI-0711]OTA04896.1 hypothetical protein A9Z42_0054920 [Trichoderma parareesei]
MSSLVAAYTSADDFSFANGVFLAESSGRNKHRRASLEELQAHFASGSDRDFAAHWFEAQLLHYGLRPSKVKSVARMRLFDAMRGGFLSVPPHIKELEQKLKEEWTDGNINKEHATKAEGSTAKKRKAEVIVNVTVNAGSPAATASVPKRIKAGKSSEDDDPAPAPRFAVKQTARRGSGWRAPSRGGPARRASPSPISVPSSPPRTTYRARRSGGWRAPGRPEPARRPSPSPAPAPAPALYVAPGTKHMARRGGSFASGGSRIASPQFEFGEFSDSATSFDDAPPPYDEFSGPSGHFDGPSLSPLGLLNGRYDISSPYVENEWPMYGSNFSLVLTIVGSSLWGRFDLGVIEGVLYIEQRPRASSYESIPFVWRGREAEGPILYDEWNNRGSLRFLGNGSIEGHFEYSDIHFEGQRLPGQGTRSELDARTLQNEWDSYNEDEYESERVARW